jgi:hypothetical protein
LLHRHVLRRTVHRPWVCRCSHILRNKWS